MSAFLDAARDLLTRRPELKILSAGKLQPLLRKQGVPITKKQTEQLLEEEAPAVQAEIETRRVRRPSKKYYRITAVPYSFQVDIIKMKAYNKTNKGIDGLLVILDILSRKAWAYPLKGNAMKGVLDQFKSFVKDLAPLAPAFVQADDEFAAKLFKDYSETQGFVLRTNVAADDHRVAGGGDALGLMDKFVRTLRELLERKMVEQKSTEWTKFLPSVLAAYNASGHSAHNAAGGLSPDEVFSDFDELMARSIEDRLYNQELFAEKSARPDALKVGDWVRVVMSKGRFEKGRARLGVDRYKIVGTRGRGSFVLEDVDGEKLKRSYKGAELTHTRQPYISTAAAAKDPNVVEAAQREHTSAVRFKRASRLPQEPAEPAALAAPRQTRLASGAIAKRTWTRREVG